MPKNYLGIFVTSSFLHIRNEKPVLWFNFQIENQSVRLAQRVARYSTQVNGNKTKAAGDNSQTNFEEEAVAIITKPENGTIEELNETKV
jgi:hypothetical protein